jgi:hypothetical protein
MIPVNLTISQKISLLFFTVACFSFLIHCCFRLGYFILVNEHEHQYLFYNGKEVKVRFIVMLMLVCMQVFDSIWFFSSAAFIGSRISEVL